MSAKKKIKNNTPNALSTLRLGMAIGMPFLFSFFGAIGKAIYYAVGDATDMLDGFLARRLPNRTKYCKAYGKVVDPIADKSFNLMALLITIIATPVLLPILAFESIIAGVTTTRALHIIKASGVSFKGMKIKDRVKLILNTIDEMHVSILGKIKSGVIFATVLAALIAPASLPVALTFIGITTAFELPLLYRYNLERKAAKITNKLNNNKYKAEEKENKILELESDKAKIEKFDKTDEFIVRNSKKAGSFIIRNGKRTGNFIVKNGKKIIFIFKKSEQNNNNNETTIEVVEKASEEPLNLVNKVDDNTISDVRIEGIESLNTQKRIIENHRDAYGAEYDQPNKENFKDEVKTL